MKRWFIAILVQDLFDLQTDPETKTISARTSTAVWPLLFHSPHEALEYGRKHKVARNGWLPDGRLIVNWRIACTTQLGAQEASQS